jgi:hypothetical protein
MSEALHSSFFLAPYLPVRKHGAGDGQTNKISNLRQFLSLFSCEAGVRLRIAIQLFAERTPDLLRRNEWTLVGATLFDDLAVDEAQNTQIHERRSDMLTPRTAWALRGLSIHVTWCHEMRWIRPGLKP